MGRQGGGGRVSEASENLFTFRTRRLAVGSFKQTWGKTQKVNEGRPSALCANLWLRSRKGLSTMALSIIQSSSSGRSGKANAVAVTSSAAAETNLSITVTGDVGRSCLPECIDIYIYLRTDGTKNITGLEGGRNCGLGPVPSCRCP
jgi:hypothetical protein